MTPPASVPASVPMDPDDWYAELIDFLGERVKDAPDEIRKELAWTLQQMIIKVAKAPERPQ
jgi:hypothetical protein